MVLVNMKQILFVKQYETNETIMSSMTDQARDNSQRFTKNSTLSVHSTCLDVVVLLLDVDVDNVAIGGIVP